LDVFEQLVTAQGKTIVMVTHDESLKTRFSRTVLLADGELESTLESDILVNGNGK
jgi:ABC-type lipoprotein export system ATPase subunit